jgi:hypothetical protein
MGATNPEKLSREQQQILCIAEQRWGRGLIADGLIVAALAGKTDSKIVNSVSASVHRMLKRLVERLWLFRIKSDGVYRYYDSRIMEKNFRAGDLGTDGPRPLTEAEAAAEQLLWSWTPKRKMPD